MRALHMAGAAQLLSAHVYLPMTNNITPSAKQLRRAIAIQEQIDNLERELRMVFQGVSSSAEA
jgi:hypothetical protein